MKALSFTLPSVDDRSLNVIKYSGPYFYPHLHKHNEFQLMWIRKGEGSLIINHNVYSFSEGDMFLIAPNQPHVFKSDRQYFERESSDGIKGLSVFFDLQGLSESFFGLPELNQEKNFLSNSKGGFKIPEQYHESISRNLLGIKKTKGAKQLSYFLALIHELFVSKDEVTLLPKDKNMPDSKVKTQRIQTIYDYVLKNYHDNISLDNIAEKANFTVPAFCRYFKKHTGKTFVRFLNELKVNEACKKLVSEDDSLQISEIAYNCGFNSVTNFNRVFKMIMGTTPSDYQKEYFAKLKDA